MNKIATIFLAVAVVVFVGLVGYRLGEKRGEASYLSCVETLGECAEKLVYRHCGDPRRITTTRHP